MPRNVWDRLVVLQHHSHLHLEFCPQGHRPSTFRPLLRDALLVFVALFAPELMFYFALNQLICARDVVKFASDLQSFKVPTNEGGISPSDQAEDIESSAFGAQSSNIPRGETIRRNRFTLIHGFYATMGGFAFTRPFVSDDVKLTTNGVKCFMNYEPNVIPDLSPASITDRSKSNSFGKALLVVQVFWFCMNCFSRLAEHLPLSLLEVSTLAHGLFTLSSYAMWSFKPLSISEPTQASMGEERAGEASALLIISDIPH